MIRDMKKLLRKSAGLNKYFSLLIIFLFLICSCEFCCQIEEKYLFNRTDSVYRFQGIIPPVEFQYNLYEIFSNPVSSRIPEEILFDDNPSTIWLRTELSISNQYSQYGSEKVDAHFTSVLYHKYLKDSEFNIVRNVLGMAQTSAAAYLAYRHIKKYGFWK